VIGGETLDGGRQRLGCCYSSAGQVGLRRTPAPPAPRQRTKLSGLSLGKVHVGKKSVAITSVRIDRKLMRTVRRLALMLDTSANTVICDSIAF